ncbi:MAG: MiaB/RimO family radical SAM methylthiotransferase [Patescibacteria group bacterium]
MKYFITTFGCQANIADSERIAARYLARGFTEAASIGEADHVIINTCMVRQSAENRAYGLINNLSKFPPKEDQPRAEKIILTGCLVGLAVRDKGGKMLVALKKKLPRVDEFLPIEEVGFDLPPVRSDKLHAWVPISNGCNNYCTYCVVPYTRGPEVSRPYGEIIAECRQLLQDGYKEVTLLGQNVNSYGADLIKVKSNEGKINLELSGRVVEPVVVKHLGKYRIPTLFPFLLEDVAKMGFSKVSFISSNPWDFSDELISVIARNENISREIHLPVQSGDDEVLKKMNRWYNRSEYLQLAVNLKFKIRNLKLSTDIIVGFPGETEEQFLNTVELAKEVNFTKAYVAMYSPRPATTATKTLVDDIPHLEKKRRWQILEDLINKPNLKKKD